MKDLNPFFCQVASLLSFGEPPKTWTDSPPFVETDDVCLADFATQPDKLGALATVTKPLSDLSAPDAAYDGKRVVALEVSWINIPDKERNPRGLIGHFVARIHLEPEPK